MKKPKIGYSDDKNYIRFNRLFAPEEFLSLVGTYTREFWGIPVNMGSDRYLTFKEKGVNCVACGAKALGFYLETPIGRQERRFRDPESQNLSWQQRDGLHFNLYAIDERGNEVLMTKDHIVPVANGGEDGLDNYQPLCVVCNQKKGTKSMDEFMGRSE